MALFLYQQFMFLQAPIAIIVTLLFYKLLNMI